MPAFPDAESRKLIEHYGARIGDGAERLNFVLRASQAAARGAQQGRRRLLGSWGRRLTALDALCRASLVSVESLGFGERALLLLPRLWGIPAAGWKIAAASVCVLAVFTQAAYIGGGEPEPPLGSSETEKPANLSEAPTAGKLDVWVVETQGEVELYSNGLRVSNRWLSHTGPRDYGVYGRGPGAETREIDRRKRPLGLIYHTTESDLPTLERSNNQAIRYQGRKLLSYIGREHLYHFLIDRFGQVYRTVPETEYAYHAGYSLWAEGGELYINLNQSFIGISFETRPSSVGPDTPPEEGVTAAQFSSARLLTEMLREKFGILEANCVTHEMVSVNPRKMLIGYHTDWRGRFPFAKVGLPDNYETILTSVAEWGFGYDSLFVAELGGDVWPGVSRSRKRFRREATLRGLSAEQYRRQQKTRFQALVAEVRKTTPALSWADHGS